jgi:hypothetical protein
MRRMSLRVVMCAATTAVLVAGCSSSGRGAAQSWRAAVAFRCCSALDVHRVYHPGEVLTLHWIESTTTAAAPATPVDSTLTAHLDGGFPSATQAKADRAHAPERVHSAPVRVTDRATSAPTSRLRIPADAVPGWYDLTTSVASQGNLTADTSVIRVAARH